MWRLGPREGEPPVPGQGAQTVEGRWLLTLILWPPAQLLKPRAQVVPLGLDPKGGNAAVSSQAWQF